VTIKNKLAILIGYILGLSCLFLITYRTIVAFLSNSKAITIYINRFGEQYLDLIALAVFWIISIIGLFLLLKNTQDEKITEKINQNNKTPILTKPRYSSYYISKKPNKSKEESFENLKPSMETRQN